MNYKKYLILVFVVGVVAHGSLYYLNNTEKKNQNKSQDTVVLAGQEQVDTTRVCREQIKSLKWNDKINVYKNQSSGDMRVEVVSIKDEKYDFLINDVNVGSIDSFIESNCHFYTTKFLNVERKPEALNYDASLWQYSYTGKGKKILDFTERTNEDNIKFIYSLGYSVDPKEKFVALSHGYVYEGEMYLYVKELETLKDVTVIDLKNNVFKYHPEMFGDVLFENAHWSKDGKYFLVPFHDQADVIGYIRVNLVDGSHQVYDTYLGTMAGDQINIDSGWTTFDDGPEWSGWSDIEESTRDEWKAKEQKVNFGIYNIYTKEKRIIEQVDDTTHWHEPRWIDDNTLEYTSISGEKKTYKILN